ncbi:hypothetical protein PR003_g22773 [Phytophthora rubi]|uniref:Uncharacterized protein n=1 Tax=Phytophthora rubi TaxID=129364 RepID=A0A6A3J7W2_9STRA|nr:hypothetical protein PR002_g20887 [Phytophthora rubi]KAE8992454.1 hypothetical protein PR001_g20936 [Phytophthora rubi]KAE9300332.1 hypothetical protein PR003_g22773 [Phytophthora rubi]
MSLVCACFSALCGIAANLSEKSGSHVIRTGQTRGRLILPSTHHSRVSLFPTVPKARRNF